MKFDLTPDPRVLIALTHTPLAPLDALCELIDNAIDSFDVARLQGSPIDHPLVTVQLPGGSEVGRFDGLMRVRDNGPGLSGDMAEKALKAGFSGKGNPYDSLGLFGMGFNISTGKLGRITRFVTARESDNFALEAVVDLLDLVESGSYEVAVAEIPKPEALQHGTLVEIRGWWPDGNPNAGFIRKLVGYGRPRIRAELGRRYATLLRARNIRIVINGDPCVPFEHCVWDKSRFVERRGHGVIPAVIEMDETVGNQRRCTECNALVQVGDVCPECGSMNIRAIQERIRGWIGVQRFDDLTRYGIDLIRNGRSIRIAEKAAFFEHTDEFKETVIDYPIDQTFGRIVGEIHLDHVPVDFLKQDFQRSSPEWQRAMSFVRGDSSLQPRRPGASENESPMFRLYQGYRKVRVFGTSDMYMGYNDGQPRRVSRDLETEYYERFLRKEPGFYDDAEWWRKVEEADRLPLENLVECSECAVQNLEGTELCDGCGFVLLGKTCASAGCAETIAKSAVSCPVCGTSQIPEVEDPWGCAVCGFVNESTDDACGQCGKARGTPPPSSREHLALAAAKDDRLSIAGFSLELADGSHSDPVDVDVFITAELIRPAWESDPVPLVVFKSVGRVEVFVSSQHPVIASYGIPAEILVAGEVALYVHDSYRHLSSGRYQASHSLTALQTKILQQEWSHELEDSPERVAAEIKVFFDLIREKMPEIAGDKSDELYTLLSTDEQRALVGNLLGEGQDISELTRMRKDGSFIAYLDESALVTLLRETPELFFDGNIWKVPYAPLAGLGGIEGPVALDAMSSVHQIYVSCMEDCLHFLRLGRPEQLRVRRARASLELLKNRLEN